MLSNYQNKYHKSPHHIRGADPASSVEENQTKQRSVEPGVT